MAAREHVLPQRWMAKGMASMLIRQILVVPVVTSVMLLSSTIADEVRYYQQNGITYQETRRTVERPVWETKMQETTRTVYKEEYYTETKDVNQVYWYLVTTYRPNTYWVGRWNPFVEPYQKTDWIPETCWQQQTQTVKMPVTCRRLVPQEQKVQTPVSMQKMVTEEVVSRVAVSGPAYQTVQQPVAAPTPTFVTRYSGPVYWYGPIGGIARLNQDPPRYGVGTTWGASSTR